MFNDFCFLPAKGIIRHPYTLGDGPSQPSRSGVQLASEPSPIIPKVNDRVKTF